MIKVNCLNPIAACGMGLFDDKYEMVDDFVKFYNSSDVIFAKKK